MNAPRPHERLALEMLLAGDTPVLCALRDQAKDMIVGKRTYSSAGEYVDLVVSAQHQPVEPSNIILDDIAIKVEGVEHSVFTILYVVEGKLSFLEFSTASDSWPENPRVVYARYVRAVETAPGKYALEPVPTRDQKTLRRALEGRSPKSAA